ncbi:hypothetical protein AAFF_G00171050 [Aldrovandia affinis]|uniref:Uncharacterized protein n=1 Tax=Aldrovandia affinis TaxID=143900 RepID=A0AAD7W7N1_9TELE|nr:hypothetical protein AAFF_G00171050 [Aldrovandia affinis]
MDQPVAQETPDNIYHSWWRSEGKNRSVAPSPSQLIIVLLCSTPHGPSLPVTRTLTLLIGPPPIQAPV